MMNALCCRNLNAGSVLRSIFVSLVALASVVVVASAAASATGRLPADSVYQLDVPLTDQNGGAFRFAERRGTPVLVTMFFANCQFVCPRIFAALKATEAKLTPAERARLRAVAVTFDPERDDTAALKGIVEEHHLDGARNSVARTDARNVRKLAAALGIQYRALPSGDFNHTSALILLDVDGRIVGKTGTLGEADPVFVKLVKKTLAASATPIKQTLKN